MPSSRQLAGLPLLSLWASESNVRHFGPASNAPQSLTAALPSSRQLAGLPLLSFWASQTNFIHFAPTSPHRSLVASLWPVRSLPPLFLWASEGNVRHFRAACFRSLSAAGRPLAASLFKSLSAAGRPLAASLWPVRSLPPLFLWASEGNVKNFGPASKASRQPAGLLRPLCGLSEACLLSSYGLPKATLGILDRLQTLPRASPQPCPLLGSWQACLFSSYGLPKATLGTLARLQTLPRASPQPCPLLGSWQAYLFSSYGLPKATLGTLARLQTLPRASPQPCPLLGSWQACLFSCGLPKATLGTLARLQTLPRASPQPCPLLGSWQACLFSPYGLPKATLGTLARRQTLPRASPQPCPLLGSWQAYLFSRQLAGLPLLFLWASDSDVRHFGPASNAPQRLWPNRAPQPCPRLGSWQACLFSSYGLPTATLGILARLQTLPSAFGLLLRRSLACVRREPGEGASGTCSPCTAALELSLWNPHLGSPQTLKLFSAAGLLGLRLLFLRASESEIRRILDRPQTLLGSWQACLFSSYGLPTATLGILARLQTLPSAFGLLLHRSLACVRREPGEGASGTVQP